MVAWKGGRTSSENQYENAFENDQMTKTKFVVKELWCKFQESAKICRSSSLEFNEKLEKL